MSDDRPTQALIESIGKRPATETYGNGWKAKQETYDSARAEIENRVRDAEWARADADGYRVRMVEQAGRIAELEAEIARLTRAAEIDTPAPSHNNTQGDER